MYAMNNEDFLKSYYHILAKKLEKISSLDGVEKYEEGRKAISSLERLSMEINFSNPKAFDYAEFLLSLQKSIYDGIHKDTTILLTLSRTLKEMASC